MPKWLEEKLKKDAKKKGLSKEKQGAYVYGNKAMQEAKKKKEK